MAFIAVGLSLFGVHVLNTVRRAAACVVLICLLRWVVVTINTYTLPFFVTKLFLRKVFYLFFLAKRNGRSHSSLLQPPLQTLRTHVARGFSFPPSFRRRATLALRCSTVLPRKLLFFFY